MISNSQIGDCNLINYKVAVLLLWLHSHYPCVTMSIFSLCYFLSMSQPIFVSKALVMHGISEKLTIGLNNVSLKMAKTK